MPDLPAAEAEGNKAAQRRSLVRAFGYDVLRVGLAQAPAACPASESVSGHAESNSSSDSYSMIEKCVLASLRTMADLAQSRP